MSDTSRVKTTLARDALHVAWTESFRSADNEPFFELAFEHIAKIINPAKDATILDAGCGSGRHSVRLARHGLLVTGIDFSDFVLRAAEQNVENLGLKGRVAFQQQDLLQLTFSDETFDYVLCWGVLMHVPAVTRAISELSRVLKKGGMIVVSEVNVKSTEVVAQEFLRPWLGGGKVTTKRTEAGIEAWTQTKAGDLMSRRTDIGWLIGQFQANGMELVERRAGQFTELYTRLKSGYLRRLIHAFNNFCFKHIDIPALACGNIITMKKRMT
jgi:2-polyprenyl-3-methyl-5-hydroxy-6-metoxy-1,4-benzoquinol methylase